METSVLRVEHGGAIEVTCFVGIAVAQVASRADARVREKYVRTGAFSACTNALGGYSHAVTLATGQSHPPRA